MIRLVVILNHLGAYIYEFSVLEKITILLFERNNQNIGERHF